MLVNLIKSSGLIEYGDAMEYMSEYVSRMIEGAKGPAVWLLEHQNIYTAGSSAEACDLLSTNNLPIHHINRGGKYTYHGPGQRIVYFFCDLKKMYSPKPDIKRFVRDLEESIILTLEEIGVKFACRNPEYPGGVWVADKKIAFIGIKVKKWIAYHGISINISPELRFFDGIVPCGIWNAKVTSVQECGVGIGIEEFDDMYVRNLFKVMNWRQGNV